MSTVDAAEKWLVIVNEQGQHTFWSTRSAEHARRLDQAPARAPTASAGCG
jgi:hypothetical protein